MGMGMRLPQARGQDLALGAVPPQAVRRLGASAMQATALPVVPAVELAETAHSQAALPPAVPMVRGQRLFCLSCTKRMGCRRLRSLLLPLAMRVAQATPSCMRRHHPWQLCPSSRTLSAAHHAALLCQCTAAAELPMPLPLRLAMRLV